LCVLEMGIPAIDNLAGEQKEKAIDEWVANNADIVRRRLNKQRNYVQGQLREFQMDILEKGGELPTIQEVEKCLKRDPVFLATAKGKKVFELYWESYLTKVSGNEHWPESIRHGRDTRISTTKHGPSITRPKGICNITPHLEAFTVVLHRNGYQKWHDMAADKKKFLEEKDGEAGDDDEDGIWVYDPKAAYAQTPFVNPLECNNQWGGWNQEGQNAYKVYREQNKAARKLPTTLELEKQCLRRVRALAGKETAKYLAKEDKKYRKRKRSLEDVADADDTDLEAEEDDEESEEEE